MSRLDKIFIAATKSDFYKDFNLPEFQKSAMDTMAKAEKLYSRAQTIYHEVVARNRSHPTPELNMDGLQDKLRGQQRNILKAQEIYHKRSKRIEKVMNRQMEGIRQAQTKEIIRVQEKEALKTRVFQQLGDKTLSQTINRASKPHSWVFNRAADRSR